VSRAAARLQPASAPPAAASRLRIGRNGDAAEVQADRAADRALAGASPAAAPAAPGDGAAAAAPPGLERRIAAARAEGRPLPSGQRAEFGERFGHDFRQVRIHDGPASAKAAREAGAQAFTLGHDIYFGEGRRRPDSGAGRELMAHELAHTLQARPGVISRRVLEPSLPDPDAAGPARSPQAGAAADTLGDLLAGGAGAHSPPARDALARLSPAARLEALARTRARQPAGEGHKLAAHEPAPGTAEPSAEAAEDDPAPAVRGKPPAAAPTTRVKAAPESPPPAHARATAAAATRMQAAVRALRGDAPAEPAAPQPTVDGGDPGGGAEGGGASSQAASAASDAIGRLNASRTKLEAVENMPVEFRRDQDQPPGDPEAAMRLAANQSLAQSFVGRISQKVQALLGGALAVPGKALAGFNTAAQGIRAQSAAQGAALQAGAQAARSRIRGTAASVRGAIGAGQADADSAAADGVKVAKARAKTAHDGAAGGLGARALKEQARIATAYIAAQGPMNAVGDDAADKAAAAAAARAAEPRFKHDGESSVLDGALHDNRMDANTEAGINVAGEYGKSFRKSASDEADKIPDSRGEVLGKVDGITAEARKGFADQLRQIEEGASAQETGAKAAAGKAAGQMGAALDGSRRQSLAGLDAAAAEQAAGLAQGAAAAEAGLDEAIAGSLSTFADGMGQAADSLTQAIQGFVETAAQTPPPEPGDLSASLAEAAPDSTLADMTAQVETVAPALTASAAEAQAGSEATSARGAAAAAEGFDAQAKTFIGGAAGIHSQAAKGFAGLKAQTKTSTDSTGQTAEDGFKTAVTNADAAYTQFGDQVEANFALGRKQVADGLWSRETQAKLHDDMEKYGQEAQDHVKPRWKKVLKWVITIVVIVAVIAVTVLSAGALGPVGVILLGAALGAAAGAVQTIADNLIDGEPWSKGVVKAMIVGAIGGAAGGAGGVLLKGVGSLALKVGLEAGVNIIGGVAGEAVGSLAVGEQINWTGALMGALVGAGIGAGLGLAGALKGKIRFGGVSEPVPFKPPAIEPPPAPATGLRGALEKAKILAPKPAAVTPPPVPAPEPSAISEPPAPRRRIGFKMGDTPEMITDPAPAVKRPIGFAAPEAPGPAATPEIAPQGPREPIGFKPNRANTPGEPVTEPAAQDAPAPARQKEPIGFKPNRGDMPAEPVTEPAVQDSPAPARQKEPIGFKPNRGNMPAEPVTEPAVQDSPAPTRQKEPIGFKPAGTSSPQPKAVAAAPAGGSEVPRLDVAGNRPQAMVIEPAAPRLGGGGPEPIRAGGRSPTEVQGSASPRNASRGPVRGHVEVAEPPGLAPEPAPANAPAAGKTAKAPAAPGKGGKSGAGAPEPEAPTAGKGAKPAETAAPETSPGKSRTPDDEFADFQQMLTDEFGAKGPAKADKMLEMYFHGDRDKVSKVLNDYLMKQAAQKGISASGKVKLGGKKVSLDVGDFSLELKGGRSLAKQVKAFVKGLQGAHSTPQTFGGKLPPGETAGLPGGKYNPKDALVVLTDTPTHTAMDQPWKDAFRALRKGGTREETGKWVFDQIADGINNTPGLSAADKASRIARLTDEMFVELGLGASTKYPVPRVPTIQEILKYIAARKAKAK
jgi:hypothetical protein